jgi:hypothetical protein
VYPGACSPLVCPSRTGLGLRCPALSLCGSTSQSILQPFHLENPPRVSSPVPHRPSLPPFSLLVDIVRSRVLSSPSLRYLLTLGSSEIAAPSSNQSKDRARETETPKTRPVGGVGEGRVCQWKCPVSSNGENKRMALCGTAWPINNIRCLSLQLAPASCSAP